MAKPRKTLLEKTTYALSAKFCIMFSLLFAMETEKKKKNYPMSRHAFKKYNILGTAHLHVHVPSYSCNFSRKVKY